MVIEERPCTIQINGEGELYYGYLTVHKPDHPPLGILPEKLWNEKREADLMAAFKRYNEAGEVVPIEWLREWQRLRLKRRQL